MKKARKRFAADEKGTKKIYLIHPSSFIIHPLI